MEFELITNVAYLALVVGILLTVFALLTPGTGFFELGALFSLAFAGWAMYSEPINPWALVLLVLGVFPFMLALRRTKDRKYLVVSAFALVIGSAYIFQGAEWWLPGVNPFLALVVSVTSGGLLWLVTIKVLEAESARPAHDISDIIGAQGETRTQVHHEGSVYVNGEHWTARSQDPIKTGTPVRVVAREGLTLEVKPLTTDSKE